MEEGLDRYWMTRSDLTYLSPSLEITASHSLFGLVLAAISGGLMGIAIGALAVPPL